MIGGRRALQGQKPGVFALTGIEAIATGVPAGGRPEFVVRHWWDRLLYNQSAKCLKSALVGEHTVIADVPYRRGQ